MVRTTTWSYSKLKWSRVKCNKWIRKRRCPSCGVVGHVVPGPDWDRFKLVCWACGFWFRGKPPKEAVRGKYRKFLV